MFLPKFLRFFKILNNKKSSKKCSFVELDRLGFRMAQAYSTRFDMLSIDKCLCLTTYNSNFIKKDEKHLRQMVPKFAPLFALMEYYDNYPYSYSDINYLFKGCLKTGVEITIKVSNNTAKMNFIKKIVNLRKKLKYILIFYPYIEKKYKVYEILDQIEQTAYLKADLKKEINSTNMLREYLEKYRDELNLNNIYFPKIYAYLSDEDIIVSEYIYGKYFYELLETHDITYHDVLSIIKSQLFFMINNGVFYNNLYSGNLMKTEEGNIYYLDCNNLGSLEKETSENLHKLLSAILLGNYPYATTILNEMSLITLNTIDLEDLENTIKNIINSSKKDYTEVFFIKLMKIFRYGSKLGMKFEDEIFSLFRSFIYLDVLLFNVIDKNTKIKTDLLEILSTLENTNKNIKTKSEDDK